MGGPQTGIPSHPSTGLFSLGGPTFDPGAFLKLEPSFCHQMNQFTFGEMPQAWNIGWSTGGTILP